MRTYSDFWVGIAYGLLSLSPVWQGRRVSPVISGKPGIRSRIGLSMLKPKQAKCNQYADPKTGEYTQPKVGQYSYQPCNQQSVQYNEPTDRNIPTAADDLDMGAWLKLKETERQAVVAVYAQSRPPTRYTTTKERRRQEAAA